MTDVVETAAPARELPFEFRATGAEYFRIWIVNLLLTIVTLGIYSAWAKVRRLRYFYGSTSLEGSSFEYHGRPIAILKGRLIVVGLYLLFIGVTRAWPLAQLVFVPLAMFGFPWVIMRARLFQMRMTSWRGLRFNFHGKYGDALAAYVGWPLLGAVTFGIMYPFALYKQAQFVVSQSAYGSERFSLTTEAGTFFRFCFIALGMGIGFAILAAFISAPLTALVAGALGTSVSIDPARPVDPMQMVALALSMGLVFGLLFLLVGAYYRVRFVNATVGGAVIGPHALRSRLQVGAYLGVVLTNLLGMIATLGLFYPWARVRLLRYQLAHTTVLAHGDTGQFVASAEQGVGAVGEEAVDFFDIDLGI
jgi:uncharacterized membrane protein YjgN (DUF898 family)